VVAGRTPDRVHQELHRQAQGRTSCAFRDRTRRRCQIGGPGAQCGSVRRQLVVPRTPCLERVGRRRGVYVSEPDGGRLRRILPAADLPRLPRWSHDGRRLAYACGATLAALCAVRPDGSRRELLTRRCNMEFDPGGGMAWSPDGRYVACASRLGGDLVTVRLQDDTQKVVRRRPPSARFLPTDITWRALPAR
jgi:hypothetical protein